MIILEILPPSPLIYAFTVSPDETVNALDWESVRSAPVHRVGVRAWYHLERRHPDARAWLEAIGDLPPFVVSVLFQEDTRPRALKYEHGLLINLRGVNMNPGAEPDDMLALRIWADESAIVTTRADRIFAADDLRDLYAAGNPPPSNGAAICFLARRLTEHLEPVVENFIDQADDLEEDLLSERPSAGRVKLADFRRSVLGIRRYISPQREAISELARNSDTLIAEADRLSLREIHDVVTRIAEDLDAIRERAQMLQEQLIQQRSEDMNQRLFVLSIISAIFLPLTFLTGLFGVNLGGIPFGASHWGFALLCAGLLALTGLVVYLFKVMDWI